MDDAQKTCSWSFYGLRCKYPASVSHNTTGAGPFYCRYHARNNDPEYGERIAQESQAFKPEDDLTHFKKEVLNTLRQKQLTKKADEPVKQWIDRLKSFCKENSGNIGRGKIPKKPDENP